MASVTTATSEWIQFFKDAGIPPSLAVNYALSFVDNRIQKNMLMDLSKEIMMDLGITVIGDIIAILKHAKQVYRQDMCKMATEAISSGQTSVQAELRRTANTPATRMIANALSRDSPPSTPARRPDNRLSVTVSNKQAGKSTKAVMSRPADEGSAVPVKRRRVTAEMEGKYIINMPKGTTARTRRILEQQAKREKGMKRTSVFERLGAESKADTTTGGKPTGVFSRLGRGEEEEDEEVGAGKRATRRPAGEEEEDGGEEEESDGEGSVLQYAGVLKRPLPSLKRAAVSSSQLPSKPSTKKPPITLRRLGNKAKLPPSPSATSTPSTSSSPDRAPPPKLSVLQRLGKAPPTQPPGPTSTAPQPSDTQDSRVTSTRTKVSSSSGGGDCLGAQMDNAGVVSVFKRLGTKRT
ncbi:uncharacterized protein C19orf47 homolog [Megalops cyprinoides]|uniref:uncharacterized protein C19orf47 homolog n=1 Tax=Megalops cyprinoides TaxID=118141 RepID=UPI001864AE53|nr:uncharacterized protein C19orf47 homolog [Megalops cyprinoides]